MGVENPRPGGTRAHHSVDEDQTHEKSEGNGHEACASPRSEGEGSAVHAGEGGRARVLRHGQSEGDQDSDVSAGLYSATEQDQVRAQ